MHRRESRVITLVDLNYGESCDEGEIADRQQAKMYPSSDRLLFGGCCWLQGKDCLHLEEDCGGVKELRQSQYQLR